jgi:type VI secretion system secreted protein Hcp
MATPGTTFPDIPYGGAPDVFLELTANGVQIQGDAAQKGHEDEIQCVYFSSSTTTMQYLSGTGMATGRRNYSPIVIRKRVDRATPLLAQALVQNQVAEGTFRFHRLASDGTEEHFFTIAFREGRVASQSTYSPDNVSTSGQAHGAPFLEEVSFAFRRIRWTYVPDSIEFEDSWGII